MPLGLSGGVSYACRRLNNVTSVAVGAHCEIGRSQSEIRDGLFTYL